MTEKIKIQWAFDPYTDQKETYEAAVKYLNLLKGQKGQVEITPTYILGSEHTEWLTYTYPNQSAEVVDAVKRACSDVLKDANLDKTVQETKIIKSSAHSVRTDAQSLVDDSKDYDLVIINTHARKGVERFFFGSFAESVLHLAKKPTLVMPPKANVEKIDKVFFPTTLGKSSREIFENYLKSDYRLGNNIVLYSKVIHPATTFVSQTSLFFGGGEIPLDQYLQEMTSARREIAAEWKDLAQKYDCQVEVIIDNGLETIPKSILKYAKEKECDLIAMASFSTPTDALLVGSTARAVIRDSDYPVLVWHCEGVDL